jgi:hypothetical protein
MEMRCLCDTPGMETDAAAIWDGREPMEENNDPVTSPNQGVNKATNGYRPKPRAMSLVSTIANPEEGSSYHEQVWYFAHELGTWAFLAGNYSSPPLCTF